MIALVDYGAGNLTSVRKALTAVGAAFWTPSSPGDLARASGVIVPGVGHFSTTASLDVGWMNDIRSSLERGVPLLGICVGMQWLFEGSTEAPGVPGLGVLPGMCTRLGDDARLQSGQPLDNAPVNGAQSGADTRPSDVGMTGDDAPALAGASRLKVPHVGWNSLLLPRPTRLFEGVPGGTQVYFTHSFAAPLVAATAAATTHGVTFSAAVEDGLVAGVQFHAEKSGDAGLRILRNWLAGVTGARP